MPIISKNGYTLVEIVVTTVILSLITLGMLGVFVSGNKQVLHTRERMTSSELGKFFIDPMQMAVRQDSWGLAGNVLNLGTDVALPNTPQTINRRSFSGTYTTTAVANTDLRRVKAKITWVEPTY